MSNYVGVDVAKSNFCVAFENSTKVLTFSMEAKGRDAFVRRLLELQEPAKVVMEATGGYERALVETLVSNAIAVSVLNPRQARDFAKATGQLAKTDAIDAKVLLHLGSALRPEPNGEQHVHNEPLRRLAARRRQLIEMQIQEKNRLEHAQGVVRKMVRTMIRQIEKQLEQIETELNTFIEHEEQLHQRREQLISVPGIAQVTANQLLAFLPQLGNATRREIAALAGLAPKNRDSGTFRGKRMTGGGRHIIRRILYMPTLVAIQHNPPIRAYYQRLLAKGKSKMTALTAAMRKLLTIMNTMLQNNEYWKNSLDFG